MKKLFYTMMGLIFTLFFAGSVKAQSSVLSWNFESKNIGDQFTHIGWSQADVQAVVAVDPVASGNKVLKNTINNYNAAPVLRFVLPAGKTLADYSSFTFKGYFAQGDVGYKHIMVEAYQTMPTGQFGNTASAKIGDWARNAMGSTSWENINLDITNSSALKDTIYIAFGISCAGTGDVGGTGVATIWYADNVTLVPKPATSNLSWDFESNTIGDQFAHIGWSQSDVQAVVAADPVASGNKVLKNTINNYNAAPVLRFVLPAGKTLADYSSFTFKGYFSQGDVGYKHIMVEAYQTMPTGQFGSNASAKIGDWARNAMGSTSWENINLDIPNSSTMKDTIYIAFGISCAGTGNVGGTGVATIWYADNVTLVPKASNNNSIFAVSKNLIDFGSDTVGVAKKQSVTISNTGTDTLKVTAISSTNALFSFSPSVFVIAPSKSSDLTITFTPVDTSSQAGFIILTHNAAGSPDSISVKGKGIQGAITIPIVTNGSFESSNVGIVQNTDVKGWLIQVATGITPPPVFEIVSDTVKQGNRALKVTVNSAGTNQWDIQIVADSLHVKPGGIYDYSIWAKAEKTGAQVNFTIGNYSYSEYKAIRPATLTTQWKQFTAQFSVTDNQIIIRAPIHFSYAGNSGNTIYIDNLQITEYTPPTVDSSKVYKGPALATGQAKFLGNAYGDVQDNKFATYWTQLTPGNAGKWGSVASSQDTTKWNWTSLTNQYNYAQGHSLIFKDHNLIWGQQQPSWISALDSTQQIFYIETWIRMVGQRFPKTDMVDVVNEPLVGHNPPDGTNGNANYIKALGGKGKTGWDWVIKAFQLARKYMPNTKLLINEYGILGSTSATASYLQIINLLKDRGLIDGIGVQGHRFTLESADTNVVKTNLTSLGATGLPVYVSELDLGNLDNAGTPNDATQLQLYKKIFPVLWKHPAVKGITLWGYLQNQTWQATCYLVNSDGTSRSALEWLAQYVKDHPTDVRTVTSNIPIDFALQQNYPNPFNPSTNIRFSLSQNSNVKLEIFNALGQRVAVVVNNQNLSAGSYEYTFDASKLSSGVYFYHLEAGNFSASKKMVILK